MFNMGFVEMLAITIIALVVIGPKQLPHVARVIGRVLGEFRRATGDFHREIYRAEDQFHQQMHKVKESVEFKLDDQEADNAVDENLDEKLQVAINEKLGPDSKGNES